jgi:hypothetical protein
MGAPKTERRYRIKHKVTGLYYFGYKFSRKKGYGSKIFKIPCYSEEPNELTAYGLTLTVRRIVDSKLFEVLDECEIETVEIKHIPIKGTIRMKHVREREEQKEIMRKLKQG